MLDGLKAEIPLFVCSNTRSVSLTFHFKHSIFTEPEAVMLFNQSRKNKEICEFIFWLVPLLSLSRALILVRTEK